MGAVSLKKKKKDKEIGRGVGEQKKLEKRKEQSERKRTGINTIRAERVSIKAMCRELSECRATARIQ